MDAHGAAICTPRAPRGDAPTFPIMDLKSGYVLRAVNSLPKQGASPPWRLHQNYIRDIRMLRHGPVDDELDLSKTTARERELAAVA
jgi:hypothetical protein